MQAPIDPMAEGAPVEPARLVLLKPIGAEPFEHDLGRFDDAVLRQIADDARRNTGPWRKHFEERFAARVAELDRDQAQQAARARQVGADHLRVRAEARMAADPLFGALPLDDRARNVSADAIRARLGIPTDMRPEHVRVLYAGRFTAEEERILFGGRP